MKLLYINAMPATEEKPGGGIFITKRIEALRSLGVRVKPVAMAFRYSGRAKRLLSGRGYNVNDRLLDRQETVKYVKAEVSCGLFALGMTRIFSGYYGHMGYRRLRALRLTKPDLIHLHWIWPFGLGVMKYARRAGIPYVVTCHGSEITQAMKLPHVRNNIVRILERAASVEFVSEALKENAEAYGYSGKNAVVINNGINEKVFRCQRASGPKAVTVGFVGNLIPVKGADRLPEIFARINARFDGDVRFVVVGGGELKESIEKDMQGLSVSFPGEVSQEKLAELYNEMDYLVVPSRSEGFSCVTREAQACGVTVVACDCGGIGEAMGAYGYLIPSVKEAEIPERMAEAIFKDAKEGAGFDRKEMLAAAQDYSWEKQQSLSIDNYNRILKG